MTMTETAHTALEAQQTFVQSCRPDIIVSHGSYLSGILGCISTSSGRISSSWNVSLSRQSPVHAVLVNGSGYDGPP